MKTIDRLFAIDSSAKRLQTGLPNVPLADVQLMRLIRVASLGISACVEPVLRPKGLNESELHTLMLALSGGESGTTPGALCDQVGQTRANMTRILDVLARQKLIVIKADGRDGRRKRVSATETGRKLAQACTKALKPVIESAMNGLTDEEKQRFELMLRRLIGSLGVEERRFAGAS